MADQLEHEITTVNPAELAGALVAAWRELFGVTPTRAAIITLMAQSAHETGRWKYVHNFNIGNVKSSLDDGRDFTFFRCREKINGKDVWFDPPHPATRFRAFRTLREGVVDHLAFLKGRKRYAAAWAALEAGRPFQFAEQLKAAGYYTDPAEVYARGMVRYFDEFEQGLPLELAPPDIDEDTRKRTLDLVARSLWEMDAAGVAAPRHVEPDDDQGEGVAVSDTEPAPPPDEEPPPKTA